MLQYQCRLSEQDYIDFNLFTVHSNPAYKRAILLVRLILPAMFLVLTAFSLAAKREGVLIQTVIYAVVILIWELLVKRLYDFITLRTIKTQLKNSGSLYAPEYTLSFNEDHILESTQQTESRVSYEKLERIAVHMGAVYVYPTSVTAMIIPAAQFPAEADRERLLAFLGQRRGDLQIEREEK
jgi:hypothetical protein